MLKSFEKYLLDLLHFKDECEALEMPCRKVVSDLEGFTVHPYGRFSVIMPPILQAKEVKQLGESHTARKFQN